MSNARLIIGDVRDALATLPDASVDLVLTSPPFLALRSYLPADHPDKHREIGAEPTPAAYLQTLLELTADWRRVLAPHGSICVELGDTYSGSGGAGGDYAEGGLRDGQQAFDGSARRTRRVGSREHRAEREGTTADGGDRVVPINGGDGWPLPKSMCGIPHLYHLSLAYGRNLLTGEPSPAGQWRVRNVVAWCRPNPPVGALGDKFRPATSYMTIATIAGDRWFDLDAVRGDYAPRKVILGAIDSRDAARADRGLSSANGNHDNNPAGAPPLDWWEIPTQPYVTPSGTLIVPEAGTFHHVRVPVDAPGDGIRRTVSPNCPVHGSQDRQGSSAHGGERADTDPSHNARSDGRPAAARHDEQQPTLLSLDPLGSTTATPHPAHARPATPRNNPSSKTGLAPASSPADTPCVETTAGTADTSTSPDSPELHHDTPSSRTEAADSAGSPNGQTTDRTADTHNEQAATSACSCSHWVELSVRTEVSSDYAEYPPDYWDIPTHAYSGAHYAVWPPALLTRPIQAMCPQRVCTTCGQPSRRITERTPEYAAAREAVGSFNDHAQDAVRGNGTSNRSKQLGQMTSAENITVGWTDCGCCSPDDLNDWSGRLADCRDASHWRAGVVLDPFAGSGTTLAVSTGHGRDAIGIDLDARNLDLCIERCGMFLTSWEHLNGDFAAVR